MLCGRSTCGWMDQEFIGAGDSILLSSSSSYSTEDRSLREPLQKAVQFWGNHLWPSGLWQHLGWLQSRLFWNANKRQKRRGKLGLSSYIATSPWGLCTQVTTFYLSMWNSIITHIIPKHFIRNDLATIPREPCLPRILSFSDCHLAEVLRHPPLRSHLPTCDHPGQILEQGQAHICHKRIQILAFHG